MNEPTPNALASLTPEQLHALLDTLRKQVQPTTRQTTVARPVENDHVFYHVSTPNFETFVDARDLEQPHDAVRAAQYAESNKLQAWYVRSDIHRAYVAEDCKAVTQKEYVDWLRR